MESFKPLLFLYAELLYIMLYPIAILYAVVTLNLGVASWVLIGLFLTPPTLIWYVVVKRRTERYLALLMSEPREWDVSRAVSEYVEMLEKKTKK
jgi:hypothetical protein